MSSAMIEITTSNSMSVKPFWFFIVLFLQKGVVWENFFFARVVNGVNRLQLNFCICSLPPALICGVLQVLQVLVLVMRLS